MAIQSFFKQRKPRSFEHKPIYWDARKEELDKRVERIRAELIASGELEGEAPRLSSDQAESSESTTLEMRERIKGSFRENTEHLQKQYNRGITANERNLRTVRLILMLVALGAIVWLLYSNAIEIFV